MVTMPGTAAKLRREQQAEETPAQATQKTTLGLRRRVKTLSENTVQGLPDTFASPEQAHEIAIRLFKNYSEDVEKADDNVQKYKLGGVVLSVLGCAAALIAFKAFALFAVPAAIFAHLFITTPTAHRRNGTQRAALRARYADDILKIEKYLAQAAPEKLPLLFSSEQPLLQMDINDLRIANNLPTADKRATLSASQGRKAPTKQQTAPTQAETTKTIQQNVVTRLLHEDIIEPAEIKALEEKVEYTGVRGNAAVFSVTDATFNITRERTENADDVNTRLNAINARIVTVVRTRADHLADLPQDQREAYTHVYDQLVLQPLAAQSKAYEQAYKALASDIR